MSAEIDISSAPQQIAEFDAQAVAATVLPDSWRSAWHIPDDRQIWDWAHDNITLPLGVFTVAGKFDIAPSSHFKAIFAALKSTSVREVNLCAPVRGGKTLIADIYAPWATVEEYAPILRIMQTQEAAEEHAETRVWPIYSGCKPIQQIYPQDANKARKGEILFANGLPFYLKGPALSNLQGKSFRGVIIDEAWLLARENPGAFDEARARVGSYLKLDASKIFVLSQGGETNDAWHKQFLSATLYRRMVPCSKCGGYMYPGWSMMNKNRVDRAGMCFDLKERSDGTYDPDATAATARFVCPSCGNEHKDTPLLRDFWNRHGKYFVGSEPVDETTHDFARYCSFRWSAVIDTPWDHLVREWIKARNAAKFGDPKPTVVFSQKYLAEFASEFDVSADQDTTARVIIDGESGDDAKKRGAVPGFEDEAGRLLTADKQQEHYWVQVRVFSKSGKNVRVFFGKLFSYEEIENLRKEWNVPQRATLIDCGYQSGGVYGVFAACCKYGWIAVKGDTRKAWKHKQKVKIGGKLTEITVEKPWSEPSRQSPASGLNKDGLKQLIAQGILPAQTCVMIVFSSDVMKDRVQALRDSGIWQEPAELESDEIAREYYAQLKGEYKKDVIERGRKVSRWVAANKNNHAIDLNAMACLGAWYTKILESDVEDGDTNTESAEQSD